MKTIISSLIVLLSITTSFAQDILGVWHGVTKAPNNKEITFVFFFEKEGDGYKSTMAVPTFNVSGIKPKTTTLANGKLTIDASALSMRYEGEWNKNTHQFEGTYQEGNMKLDLKLKKGNPKIAKLNRPQEPVKPYPYLEEQVTFTNEKAGVTLAGTFTRPSASGKYPVVVLISGSGPQDRDESFMTHRPFLVLADYLTRNNIAVLRYDDRGYGESTGDFHKATTADFTQDAISAVNHLKSRTDIDANHIGLIGHSEGGIIAPLAANQCADISFMISLAGTGISGMETALLQSKTLRPFPVADEEAFAANAKKAVEIAASNLEYEERKEALLKHNTAYLTPLLKGVGATDENITKYIHQGTEVALKPWNHFFYNYNPADEYEKIKIPVLSLNGSKDMQVDAKINQAAIRKALEVSKSPNYKVLELEGMNHLFQECKTGNMQEYKEIEQTFSPIALEEISKWILETIRKI